MKRVESSLSFSEAWVGVENDDLSDGGFVHVGEKNLSKYDVYFSPERLRELAMALLRVADGLDSEK